MRKIILTILCLMQVSQSYAAIPNTDDPTTFTGGTVRGKLTRSISDASALSVLGEAGTGNFRIGGTFGWFFNEQDRLKISAEYLWQNIKYAFFSGNTKEWVNQGAIGAHYQRDLAFSPLEPQFDLRVAYSHAPSKNLSPIAGSYTNPAGTLLNFMNHRRIAGSDAGFISPGLSVAPWRGGRVGAELNYDNVQYDKKYLPDREAEGFGGTLRYKQYLTNATWFEVLGGLRQPFNLYQATLMHDFVNSPWSVGVDGYYVDGRETLPNTYNIGLNIRYTADGQVTSTEVDKFGNNQPVENRAISDWVTNPAVYLPQVLAVADQNVRTTAAASCSPPLAIGTIPNQSFINPGNNFSENIPTAGNFSGTAPLSYAVSTNLAMPMGTNVIINSTTGVVTINSTLCSGGSLTQSFGVTVTASNSCGQAVQQFSVDIDCVPT